MKRKNMCLGLLVSILAITAVSTSTLAKSTSVETSARWTDGTGPSLYEKPYRPCTIAIYTDTYCKEIDDALLLSQPKASSEELPVNSGVSVENKAGLPAPSPKKQIISYTNEGQIRETKATPVVVNNVNVETNQSPNKEQQTASTYVSNPVKYPAIEETTEEVLKPTGDLEYKGSWVEKNSKWFWRDAEGEDHTGTVTVNGTVYEIPPTGLDIKPC